jgi:hypothetical protein
MNSAIAETILEQLGGNRFLAMTGARDFVASETTAGETALQFRLPRKFNGGNKLRITLRASDEYAVEFWHVKGTNIFQVGETIERVQADALRRVFTSITGLLCTL